MPNYYKYFNSIIKTELEFPELESLNTLNYDIKVNEVVEALASNEILLKKGSFFEEDFEYQLYPTYFQLKINGAGIFYIGKNKIEFFRFENITDNTIRLYLLASVYGYYLIFNNEYAFHAGVVEINGKAIGIMGESGAGKSTTLTKCITEGHGFISDDICYIGNADTIEIPVYHGPKRIKMWEETAQNLNISQSLLHEIMPDFEKKQMRINSNLVAEVSKKIIKNIYYLEKENVDLVSITEMQGFDKIDCLFRNIYKPEVIEVFGREKEAFQLCANIAKTVKLKKITRPLEQNSIQAVYEAIYNDTIN